MGVVFPVIIVQGLAASPPDGSKYIEVIVPPWALGRDSASFLMAA